MEVHLMNNQIILIGRVGNTPHETVFSDTGNRVAHFSIGVKEYSANTDEDKTMWLDVDAWNGLSERVAKYITKGREVAIYGRLFLDSYDKEVQGQKITLVKPKVKLTSFHLCGSKPAENGETPEVRETTTKPKKLKAVNA
jgi:single-strand DNA-binding protein